MATKQTRTPAKSTPKAKAALRKVTVRDLAPKKEREIDVKGGTYTYSRH